MGKRKGDRGMHTLALSTTDLHLLEKIDRGVEKLEREFDEFKRVEFKQVHDRITALEQWRWWLLGIFTATTTVLTISWSMFGSAVLSEIRAMKAPAAAVRP